MTDEMVWALREKHGKGVSVRHMSEDYGIKRRTIAAVVGEGYRDKDPKNWKCASLMVVRDMLLGGCEHEEIAEEFGVPMRVLRNVISQNRDLFRPLDPRG